MERLNEAVGGVAGDDVDFFVDEGAVDEAEIHDAGRSGKMQTVKLAPAAKTVGALEEFVSETRAHLGDVWDDVAGVAQVQVLGVITTNHHGEGVFKAEGLGNLEIEPLGVALPDAIVNVVGICARRFVEYSGQCSASVFHVQVEIAGDERLLAEQRAA